MPISSFNHKQSNQPGEKPFPDIRTVSPWLLVAALLLAALLPACGAAVTPEAGFPRTTITVDQGAVATQVEKLLAVETATVPAPSDTIEPQPPAPVQETTPPAIEGEFLSTVEPPGSETACLYFPQEGALQPLPKPDALAWQAGSGEAGRWRVLEGFVSPLQEVKPAPGGRWWAARVLRKTEGASPAQTALYVLDGAGSGHWMATDQGYLGYHEYAWTAGSRLVWVSAGSLWSASASGQDRVNLNAPEPVFEVWSGAGNLALVSGQSGLWRLDLAASSWELVGELVEAAARLGPTGFSSPQANLSLSADGAFAALTAMSSTDMNNAAMWKVPLQTGEPARMVTEVAYLGRGGRMPPPVPLAGSPFWYPNQPVGQPDAGGGTELALVDEDSGQRTPILSLVPDGQDLLGVQVSPDSRWLALQTSPQGANPSQAEWSVVVIPSADLEAGIIIPGDAVMNWRPYPPAAWVIRLSGEQQSIEQVDLLTGSLKLMSEITPQSLHAVAGGPNSTLIFGPERALVFDPSGMQTGEVPLPVWFSETTVRTSGPTGEMFLAGVSAREVDGICSYRFPAVLWVLP